MLFEKILAPPTANITNRIADEVEEAEDSFCESLLSLPIQNTGMQVQQLLSMLLCV